MEIRNGNRKISNTMNTLNFKLISKMDDLKNNFQCPFSRQFNLEFNDALAKAHSILQQRPCSYPIILSAKFTVSEP